MSSHVCLKIYLDSCFTGFILVYAVEIPFILNRNYRFYCTSCAIYKIMGSCNKNGKVLKRRVKVDVKRRRKITQDRYNPPEFSANA